MPGLGILARLSFDNSMESEKHSKRAIRGSIYRPAMSALEEGEKQPFGRQFSVQFRMDRLDAPSNCRRCASASLKTGGSLSGPFPWWPAAGGTRQHLQRPWSVLLCLLPHGVLAPMAVMSEPPCPYDLARGRERPESLGIGLPAHVTAHLVNRFRQGSQICSLL